MSELQIFTNEEFGSVRSVMIYDEPWLVGKDVAEALGYSNTRDAIAKHVDAEDRDVAKCDTPGGSQNFTVINESGLYGLVLSSKLPSAKKFRRWVTAEVLPSIRRHGAYATGETIDRIINNPDFGIRLLSELKAEREKARKLSIEVVENQRVIAQLRPKADYVDKILRSSSTVVVTQIAKDYGMSATAFNRLLYSLGIQWRVHGQWVLYAEHAGKGYTHSDTWTNDEGVSRMSTKWTQKGRLFLYEELKKAGYLPIIEREAAS